MWGNLPFFLSGRINRGSMAVSHPTGPGLAGVEEGWETGKKRLVLCVHVPCWWRWCLVTVPYRTFLGWPGCVFCVFGRTTEQGKAMRAKRVSLW